MSEKSNQVYKDIDTERKERKIKPKNPHNICAVHSFQVDGVFVVMEFDEVGMHRLRINNSIGYWDCYEHPSRLMHDGREYLGLTEYFGIKEVFGLIKADGQKEV